MKSHEVSKEDPRRLFLAEGGRSYLDAATALFEYRREVQTSCKKILAQHLNEYLAALGLANPPAENEINDFATTETSWTGLDAHLGAMISGEEKALGISWWTTYCALGWDKSLTPAWFGVWVSLWLPTRKLAESFYDELRAVDSSASLNEKETWIAQPLQMDEGVNFEARLEELLSRWIQACRNIGGFKALLDQG